MNAQQLSQRLMKVAEYVPAGAVVADIGSDHAYLPCHLIHNRIARSAIAGEVVRGPYESARKKVREEGLENQITVRLASGLEAIDPADGVTAVTIAGMGGSLIASILSDGQDRLSGVERLVLQPNIHAQAIREWAVGNQWKIVAEDILKENDKIYEILVLEPSMEPVELTSKELLFGPILLTSHNSIFFEKWQHESAQWKAIAERLNRAEETAEIQEKKRELTEKLAWVKEVGIDENA